MTATAIEILLHDGSSIRISAHEVREVRHYVVEQSAFVTLVVKQMPLRRGLIHEFTSLVGLGHALETSSSAR